MCVGKLLTYWYVVEHFILALAASPLVGTAVYLSRVHIIKIMLLIAMPAKALTCWPYGFAVYTIGIPPVHVETVFTGFFNLLLILLKFLITHHLAIIGITHYILIIYVGLYVLGRISLNN